MNEILPWQLSQWQRLMESRAVGRLSHALLCRGPAGLGKETFAQQFAQTLLCDQSRTDGGSCGVCRSCRLFRAGTHPDYIRVEPGESGKFIKVDQIRELCSFLGYTSQFRGYKIALLVSAQRMNIHAANSLLKTLEEPPADSLLLLITSLPSQLPATVRSRCQNLIFHLPDPAQALPWLASRLGDSDDPNLLLNLAGGAPLKALNYAKEERLQWRQALFKDFIQVVEGQANPVRAAEFWVKEDIVENLRWLMSWHMDMIRLKMLNDPPRFLNLDLQTPLQHLAEKLPAEVLFRRLDAVIQMHTLSVASQVNLQLMIEAFLGECAGG